MVNNQVEDNKQLIIKRFNEHVKGKLPDTSQSNTKHSGKEGHWLEKQMGIAANSSNTPDLFGFEMKKQTPSKTTFGDWSADYYIFKDPNRKINKSQFLHIFGKANEKKAGRYSWSGSPVPKIDVPNLFGQYLKVDEHNNILALYDFLHDERSQKSMLIPIELQREVIVLARWDCASIQAKVERKFNQSGWFRCLKNIDGVYETIEFGVPISYDNWINLVKKGIVFFDSGMYEGNSRLYSQWRANNLLWDSLIIRDSKN